jgi:hypothetical protein
MLFGQKGSHSFAHIGPNSPPFLTNIDNVIMDICSLFWSWLPSRLLIHFLKRELSKKCLRCNYLWFFKRYKKQLAKSTSEGSKTKKTPFSDFEAHTFTSHHSLNKRVYLIFFCLFLHYLYVLSFVDASYTQYIWNSFETRAHYMEGRNTVYNYHH